MALLVAKWRRGLDTSLDNTELTNGNIYVSTDTGRLHIDIDDARIEITDFVKLTEEEILNTLTPLPKFYYATDTYRLWYYDTIDGWCCLGSGTAEKIEASPEQTTQAYLVGLTASNTKPIYDPDVYLENTAGGLHAITYNGYELNEASSKAVTDATEASTLNDENTNLVTERKVYFGLPSVNGSHEYNSDTNIYAPTETGEPGYILSTNDTGELEWTNTAPKATSAQEDDQGNIITETYATILYVDEVIGNLISFKVEVVEELPAIGEQGIIYLLRNAKEVVNDIYEEYIWIPENNGYEKIGTTEVDLDNYVTLTGREAISNKTYEGYTLGDACEKDIVDASEARTIEFNDSDALITERAVYNGLPNINDSHDYNADSDFYAPVTPGNQGQVLVSSGSGAPVWSNTATTETNNGNVIFYGISSDEDTLVKHVDVGDFSPFFGEMVIVTFSTKCDPYATLNISGTGATPIYHMGRPLRENMIQEGATATFIFNGEYYLLISTDTEAGSDYYEAPYDEDDNQIEPNSIVKFSEIQTFADISSTLYAISSDESTTEKTANITDFSLSAGSIVVITFETRADENCTLNISDTGAKYIMHMGNPLKQNMIQEGTTATFVYTGSDYYLLSTDTEAGSDYLESDGGGYTINPESTPTTPFAIYSEDDGSLTFYSYGSVPTKGTIFNSKFSTDVYTGFCSEEYEYYYDPSWYSIRSLIKLVIFDESFKRTKPISTSYWFNQFYNCEEIINMDYLNTSEVINMSYMFGDCSNLKNLDVGTFNTYNVANMSGMFYNCGNIESLDIGNFDVSNVTDMSNMFYGCNSLTSLDISNFNTSKVTNMESMFYNCSNIESLDLSNFDVSNVLDFDQMFYNCSKIITLDINNWNVSNVTNMSGMFYGCGNLTSLDLSNFNTSKVTDMKNIFYNCSNLASLNISNFDTSKVTDMSNMFYGCTCLESIDISGFDVSNVTNMKGMFAQNTGLSSLDISNFNTTKVTNMESMFQDSSSIKTIYSDDDNFIIDKVSSSGYMFSGCSSLVGGYGTKYDSSQITSSMAHIDIPSNIGYFSGEVPFAIYSEDDGSLTFYKDIAPYVGDEYNNKTVSNIYMGFVSSTSTPPWSSIASSVLSVVVDKSFSTVRPISLYRWFSGFSKCTKIDLSYLDTSKVTSMELLFGYNRSLTDFSSISNWDTSNVTDMNGMFYYCDSVTSIDVSNFNTSNVTDMGDMFANCEYLTSIDVSNFNTSNVTYMNGMFYYDYRLTTIYSNDNNFVTTKVTDNGERMFFTCTNLVGGNGTAAYDSDKTDVSMAHVDTASNPGYFTAK